MSRRFTTLILAGALGLLTGRPLAALAQTGVPGGEPESAGLDSHFVAPYVRPFGGPSADSAGTDSLRSAGVDYLWVVRTALVKRDDIPVMVERARRMGVKGLLVQVVGRGDSYYRSDLLPAAEAIQEPGRDPLAELMPLAKSAGLEVHAWVNCCLVWSSEKRPRAASHVINAHPEWIARTQDGRPMTALSLRARERLMVEGVFLSPAHPGVRTHLAQVAKEIASRYPVDGIHMDYIRQPSVAIGFDPTSRARFAILHGADPLFFKRLPPRERTSMDSAWTVFQREQVTAIVSEMRDSLARVRPGLLLSAAVLADTNAALNRNKQSWTRWLRAGLLDRAFAMCYAPSVQTVMSQLLAMSTQVGVERLVPGIAVYNTAPSTAAAKIKGARALGYPAIALYSYDSLYEQADLWTRLKGYLADPDALEDRH